MSSSTFHSLEATKIKARSNYIQDYTRFHQNEPAIITPSYINLNLKTKSNLQLLISINHRSTVLSKEPLLFLHFLDPNLNFSATLLPKQPPKSWLISHLRLCSALIKKLNTSFGTHAKDFPEEDGEVAWSCGAMSLAGFAAFEVIFTAHLCGLMNDLFFWFCVVFLKEECVEPEI